MEGNLKYVKGIIDTPGLKQYPGANYIYTKKFMEKVSEDLVGQDVELNNHDSGKRGEIVKLELCPKGELYAGMLVPEDFPEDNIHFSSDVTVKAKSYDEEGNFLIEDGTLNKVVYITPDGPKPRNKNTRLCNTEEDGKLVENDTKIRELTTEIGALQNTIDSKEGTIQEKENAISKLKDKVKELQTVQSEQANELKRYKEYEAKTKDAIIKDLAKEDELQAKAYKSLELSELKSLREKMKESKKVPDTPPKGVKNKVKQIADSLKKNKPDKDEYTWEKYQEIKDQFNIK